jgi:hypothetical protein
MQCCPLDDLSPSLSGQVFGPGKYKMAREVVSFVAREFHEMAAPTAYFLLVLCLLVVTVAQLSENDEQSVISYATAAVGALLLGKAFLIADHLPWLKGRKSMPLLLETLRHTLV